MGNGSRIPANAFMDDRVGYQPSNVARPPIDDVTMEVFGGIKAEINPAG